MGVRIQVEFYLDGSFRFIPSLYVNLLKVHKMFRNISAQEKGSKAKKQIKNGNKEQ